MSRVIFLLCTWFYINAEEYLYPLDTLDQESFLLMYQKNLNHLELYQYNTKTCTANKMLMSRFNPAGVSISPSKDAFVFLDNGRLKFKKLIKRSPGSFDFDDPIYNFHTISWADNDKFYFSARCDMGTFAIFLADLQKKDITKIICKPNTDCMYPLVKDDKLYFIERRAERQGSPQFLLVSYDLLGGLSDDRVVDVNTRHLLLDMNTQPISFLIDLGPHGIAFIKYQEKIGNNSSITLTLAKLAYANSEDVDCACNEIFTFKLPVSLLNKSEFGLFESILPFLPRVFGDFILFSCIGDHSPKTSIFSYNIKTCKTSPLSINSWHANYFSPIKMGEIIIYGGNTSDTVQINQNDDGEIAITLPTLRNPDM